METAESCMYIKNKPLSSDVPVKVEDSGGNLEGKPENDPLWFDEGVNNVSCSRVLIKYEGSCLDVCPKHENIENESPAVKAAEPSWDDVCFKDEPSCLDVVIKSEPMYNDDENNPASCDAVKENTPLFDDGVNVWIKEVLPRYECPTDRHELPKNVSVKTERLSDDDSGNILNTSCLDVTAKVEPTCSSVSVKDGDLMGLYADHVVKDELVLGPEVVERRNIFYAVRDMDTLAPTEMKETKSVASNKSWAKYRKVYKQFVLWQNEKKANTFSESSLLAYFDELSKSLKATTLWGIYSMLKTIIKIEHDINIKDYSKLTTLLKRLTSGYKTKKSKVLTAENVETFLREAPDQLYLAAKVALIFGLNGACRVAELLDLKTDDIEEHNNMILVKLTNINTKIDRQFVISDEFLDIVNKYRVLRPENTENDRFFLSYNKGKCMKTPMGRHKLSAIPRDVATYLKLPNVRAYTGHCFRLSSATLLDSGALTTS